MIVGWKNWLRSVFATRIAPGPLTMRIAHAVMAKQTQDDRK